MMFRQIFSLHMGWLPRSQQLALVAFCSEELSGAAFPAQLLLGKSIGQPPYGAPAQEPLHGSP